MEKRNHQLIIQLNQSKRSEKAERSQCEKAKKEGNEATGRGRKEKKGGGKQVNVIPPFILTLNLDPRRIRLPTD